MPAAPITEGQAKCLRLASTKALDAARQMLGGSEQQAFDLEEGMALLCEAMGAMAVAFPKADMVAPIPRAVMNAGFGLLTPDAAKREAGWQ